MVDNYKDKHKAAEAAKLSHAAQVKKYGGEKGYSKEMRRRSLLTKNRYSHFKKKEDNENRPRGQTIQPVDKNEG